MLSDGLTSLQADGKAREEVEVLDVAQLLLASVKRPPAAAPQPVETKAEPSPGDVTQTEDTVSDHQDVGPHASASTPDPDAGPNGDPGPGTDTDVDVAGGESDPAEAASAEDQPGHDSEPLNEPDPKRG